MMLLKKKSWSNSYRRGKWAFALIFLKKKLVQCPCFKTIKYRVPVLKLNF